MFAVSEALTDRGLVDLADRYIDAVAEGDAIAAAITVVEEDLELPRVPPALFERLGDAGLGMPDAHRRHDGHRWFGGLLAEGLRGRVFHRRHIRKPRPSDKLPPDATAVVERRLHRAANLRAREIVEAWDAYRGGIARARLDAGLGDLDRDLVTNASERRELVGRITAARARTDEERGAKARVAADLYGDEPLGEDLVMYGAGAGLMASLVADLVKAE